MDAVFYLFVVVIGGMVVASIAISLIILVVAFASWGAIRALDVLKGPRINVPTSLRSSENSLEHAPVAQQRAVAAALAKLNASIGKNGR